MAKKANRKMAVRKAKAGTITCKALDSLKGKRNGVATLRKSITPGTVLILLSGKNRGKRVVFLKQLPSGLLMVTGPFQLNGVPVRRINQAFTLATSTKVALPQAVVDAAAPIDDKFFLDMKEKKSAASKKFITKDAPAAKHTVNANRLALQKTIDGALVPEIKKVRLFHHSTALRCLVALRNYCFTTP